MVIEDKENKLLFFSLSTLPISIIIGATVSFINILIICFFYLKIIFIEKNIDHLNNFQIKLIFCLYLYLIFNSIISMDFQIGFARNFGFIRFLFLFICINYFFYKFKETNKLLSIWAAVISVVILDIFIEFFTGTNIFGWGAIEINGILQPDGPRVVSFFQNEPIVGAFLLGFLFLIIGFYTTKFKNQKVIPLMFIIVSLLAIFCTGERANTIRFILGIFLFLAILDYFKIRLKIIFLFLFIVIFFIVLNNSNYLKERYYGQIINQINTKEKFLKFKNESLYFKLYKSGFEVFKNYPLLGVGNKNYRIETCKKNIENNLNRYMCNTHPHQIYIEFLAEHGIVGSAVLLLIFFLLFFKILKNIFITKNYIQIGSFIYVLTFFIPLIPSGSFFSDFNATLFWINMSIMYACCKKTNIFYNK